VDRPDGASRAGFAAPLAVTMLIAVALLALLLIEGALGEVRASSATAAEARVAAAAESGLADLVARRFDSTVLALPSGALVWQGALPSADSVIGRVEVLGAGIARLVITARSGNAKLRVIAGIRGFVTLAASPTLPGAVVLAPLADNWWVATP
jgi:hypothetical protein